MRATQITTDGWREGGGDSAEATMARAAERGASWATDEQSGPRRANEDQVTSQYEELTVEDLKEELRSRDLAVSGSKQELIDRLAENDLA